MPAQLTEFGRLVRVIRHNCEASTSDQARFMEKHSVADLHMLECGLRNLNRGWTEDTIAALRRVSRNHASAFTPDNIRELRIAARNQTPLGGLDLLVRNLEHMGFETMEFIAQLEEETGYEREHMQKLATESSQVANEVTDKIMTVANDTFGPVIAHLTEPGFIFGLKLSSAGARWHLKEPFGVTFGSILSHVMEQKNVGRMDLVGEEVSAEQVRGLVDGSVAPTAMLVIAIIRRLEAKTLPLKPDEEQMLRDYAGML